MTFKFAINDSVLVPSAKLAIPGQQPYALVERKVLAQTDRSITVDDGAQSTVDIASRLVHHNTLGFLVLRVGDLTSETALLDPLAKSVMQFLRLLVQDHDLRFMGLRTLIELDEHWTANHGGISHVVIIGHGEPSTLSIVGDGGSITGRALAARLEALAPATTPKTFISLACKTGCAAFAKPFSQNAVCRDFIGARGEVHGAVASQFCQSLLSHHLLEGIELPYAYKRAAKAAVGGRQFCRWHKGTMHTAG